MSADEVPGMDVVVMVDGVSHEAFRRPIAVAGALTAEHLRDWRVRSVVVVDRVTGLTSTFRPEVDQ